MSEKVDADLYDGVVSQNDHLRAENKRLRDLLNLEREFADKLINEVDQSVSNAICDEIEYHEKRAALEGTFASLNNYAISMA